MDMVYLDNNATTRPDEAVVAAMNEVNERLWANPSSVHRFGQMVRQRMELARATCARLIGCRDRDLLFTSGGTESNNLALRGLLEDVRKPSSHRSAEPSRREDGQIGGEGKEPAMLITTKVEHAAVREPAQWLERCGVNVVYLPVDAIGRASAADVSAALADCACDGGVIVVSLQWANNETGVIQPIEPIAAVVQSFRESGGAGRVYFHCDATQAVGKLPIDVKQTAIDLMTFSAHKFHGPKGAGALYLRRGVRLTPQQRGGPQERERRGGTENVAAIVGMGVAAEIAAAFVQDRPRIAAIRALRDDFERRILEALPDTVVNGQIEGEEDARLWNTSNLGFPRLESEAILLGLSERGVCASAGAACSSGSLDPSPVLLAMGVPEPVAHGSVRFSLSKFTTQDEIDAAVAAVPQVVARLGKTLPTGGLGSADRRQGTGDRGQGTELV